MLKFKKFLVLLIVTSSFIQTSDGMSKKLLLSVLNSTEFHTTQEKRNLFMSMGLVYINKLVYSSHLIKHASQCFVDKSKISDYPEDHDFKMKIQSQYIAPISIKYINDRIGFGAYTQKDLNKGDFIGEYTGSVDHISMSSDPTYAWHYPISHSKEAILQKTLFNEYCINASYFGNELQFVNDNKDSSNCDIEYIMTKNKAIHLIYVALKDIKAGEQLTVDYGDDYWNKKRKFYELAQHGDTQD